MSACVSEADRVSGVRYGMRWLYRSPALLVGEYVCPDSEFGREEERCARKHGVLIPRWGAFVQRSGERQVLVDPNHALFVNCCEPYHVSHPIRGREASTVFLLDPVTVAGAVTNRFRGAGPDGAPSFPSAPTTVDSHTYVLHRQLLARLAALASNGPGVVEAGVLGVIRRLIERTPKENEDTAALRRQPTVEQHERVVERVKLLLVERFQANIALKEVARAVSYSPFHLARIFRSVTGMPIHRYLVQLRLRAALERLAEGEVHIARVALDVGFATHSHFCDAFRREFGLSPSGFRRSLRM